MCSRPVNELRHEGHVLYWASAQTGVSGTILTLPPVAAHLSSSLATTLATPMSFEQNIGSAQDLSVDPRARKILDRALASGGAVPRTGVELVQWLNEATSQDPAGRYLTEIWRERADLWETFPGMFLDPDAPQRFRLWAHHFAAAECRAPAALIPPAPVGITDLIAPPPTSSPPTLTPGVALYGYLRATLGLGEAARRLVTLLGLADEPTLARPYDHIGSPLAYPWPDPSAGTGDAHDIAILCVNGAETARLARAIGGAALHGRYGDAGQDYSRRRYRACGVGGREPRSCGVCERRYLRRAAEDELADFVVRDGAALLHRDRAGAV